MTHTIQFPELGLNFTVNSVAFTVFGFPIQWYGIIIAVGFLLAIVYGFRSCKKMNLNQDGLFDAIILGVILGMVGARLYYVIFYPGDKYINNPVEIFNIKEGGLGIYGGIIGGLLGGVIMARIRKLKIGAVLDVASLGFLIGQGLGRWGNFVNQEAFGGPTNLPWGMQSDMTALEVVGTVHPCFLYESLLCFIGFGLLHLFTRYVRRYDGQTFLLYIVWYGISRFFIEGLRTDSLLVPGMDIRVSQLVALVSVVLAVLVLIVFMKRTTLSGCGSKKVMELHGIVLGQDGTVPKAETVPSESTIFAGKEYVTEEKTTKTPETEVKAEGLEEDTSENEEREEKADGEIN